MSQTHRANGAGLQLHPIRVPAVGPTGAGGEDRGPGSNRDPAAGAPSLLAFLGGTWFPITNGFLHTLGPFLPRATQDHGVAVPIG
jgi:hypothetical protein